MFKKTEESEWTRFSRALGGAAGGSGRRGGDAQTTSRGGRDARADAAGRDRGVPAASRRRPPREPEPVEPPAPAYAPPRRPSPRRRSAPRSAARPRSSDDETVIGDGASIEGTVRSDRSIRVFGAVQGEIESKQRVVVEESAQGRGPDHRRAGDGPRRGRTARSSAPVGWRSRRAPGSPARSRPARWSSRRAPFFEGNLRMSSAPRRRQSRRLIRRQRLVVACAGRALGGRLQSVQPSN